MICGCIPVQRVGKTHVFVYSLYVVMGMFVQVTQDVHRIVFFVCVKTTFIMHHVSLLRRHAMTSLRTGMLRTDRC